jgi:hypothetical protein
VLVRTVLLLLLINIGWFGLAAAKTYVEVNPSENVIVLESAETLGGVWSEDGLYPGLNTNNLLGTYEYSDFPMDESTFGVKPGEHIPGHVVHMYLHAYAKKFDVFRRIRFRSNVETVEKLDDEGWLVTITGKESDVATNVLTKKLILATGLTSNPLYPELKGTECFEAPLFHSKNFQEYSDTLKTEKNVVVLGGNKSGYDVAYAYASSGIKVDWVIRASGQGPVWISPPYVTPLKIWVEKLVHTRFLTWLSPCIWGSADGFSRIRRLFHNTTIGRWFVDSFWKILANDTIRLNGYDAHPATAKLKPSTNPFFVGTAFSILNYPTNFFGFVRNGQIKVHIADISHLSARRVHLSTGVELVADALVCCTGWKSRPQITFLPPGIEESLGLPHYSSEENKLALKADEEILNQFPRLKTQPEQNASQKSLQNEDESIQPYRLYRFMVPPSHIHDRSIGFVGMVMSISTAMVAQTQALWLTAYLSGKFPIKESEEEIKWQTMLHSQFGKWRYSNGHGATHPDFVFDALPYLDLLLTDLGLKSHRKSGKITEWFVAYGPKDYKGLVDEWRIQGHY